MQLDYSPDEDLVVTAVVALIGFAFEHDHGIRKQRQAGLAVQHRLAYPLLTLGTSELIRQLLLILTEHIDRVALGALPRGETVGLAPNAEQDKRGVKRQRIERTDRHVALDIQLFFRRPG